MKERNSSAEISSQENVPERGREVQNRTEKLKSCIYDFYITEIHKGERKSLGRLRIKEMKTLHIADGNTGFCP